MRLFMRHPFLHALLRASRERRLELQRLALRDGGAAHAIGLVGAVGAVDVVGAVGVVRVVGAVGVVDAVSVVGVAGAVGVVGAPSRDERGRCGGGRVRPLHGA
eukprot:4800398-Pleurochrysis_carterae.AAC.1